MVFKALISDLGTVNCVLKLTALTQTLFFPFMGNMMGSVYVLCAHYFCEKPYVQLLLLKKLLLVIFKGVYKTEVDILLQKVTVTGNVEVETLIKKLTQKTAKHVELWPDLPKPNSKDKKQIKPKSKDPAEISEEANHGGSGGGGGDIKKEKEKVKVEVDQVQEFGGSKNFEVGSSSNSKNVEDKPHEGGGGSGGGGELNEAKTGIMASQSAPVVAENSGGGESEAVGEKSSGGGKKKKKKGKNNVNAAEGEPSLDAPPSTVSAPVHNGPQPHVPNVQSPIQVLPNHGPPPQQHSPLPQQVYQYPPYHPIQPQQYYTPPVHAMNYNAAHPSISYGASRYATQPLYSQSHAYAHWGLGGTEVEPPSYHLENHPPPQSSPPPPPYYPPHPYYSSQPSDSDSFTLFSDENPNGCQIM